MNIGKTLFAQVMEYVPWKNFGRIIDRYGGDSGVRTLSCADLFRVMAFTQLTWRESLRDIEGCLSANQSKLIHMGMKGVPARSTLADALDSTTIDLCLSLFDWAPFRTTKAAVKMHTLLDLRGSIPAFIHISDGKMGDVKVLDILPVEAGAFYVMDRGYLDFTRLYKMHQAGAFFVTRAKRGMNARRVYSSKTDRTSGVVCDQTIAMNGFYIAKDYPEHLRRIRFKDPESGKTLVFLTNNTALPPADYRRAVQEPLAGRTVLQVNQATPAHQTLFGHQRERRQDANLVRRVDLRDDCYRQEGASFGGLALHIATDFVGVGFRENLYFMRPATRSPHNRNTSQR